MLLRRGEGLSCEAVLWERKQIRIDRVCLSKAHVSFRKIHVAMTMAMVHRVGTISQAPLGTISQPPCEGKNIFSYS